METSPITTFSEFREAIPNLVAHRVGGEVFPFTAPKTDLRQVMEQARTHPNARIGRGEPSDRFSATLKTPDADFQSLPLEEAIQAPIHITVFQLGAMREKDGALAEVIEQIYLPVTSLWKAQGLSWQKVLPILFLSGPNCSTNYHCDPTGVLVVQLSGRKCYHSLKEPEKWCPLEVQEADGEEVMSADLKESDILSFELNPGEALWSPWHAPHWVDAYDETAYTLSIAFWDISPTSDPSAKMELL